VCKILQKSVNSHGVFWQKSQTDKSDMKNKLWLQYMLPPLRCSGRRTQKYDCCCKCL